MGKRILVSENEKEQIRSLHENQKKEINYFQILESKVNKLLMEQDDTSGVYLDGKQGSLPALRPGETRDNGQISSTKSEELKPFTVDLTANFPANVTKPYNPTPEDLKKLQGLVQWLNNPDLKTSSVEIKVNSGSSKTGNFEDNKRLAIERGQTGIDYIKNYELLRKINKIEIFYYKLVELFLYSFPSIMNVKLESFDQASLLALLHTLYKHFFSIFNVKSLRIDFI